MIAPRFITPQKEQDPHKKLALLFTNFYHGRVSTIFFFLSFDDVQSVFLFKPAYAMAHSTPLYLPPNKTTAAETIFWKKKKRERRSLIFFFILLLLET